MRIGIDSRFLTHPQVGGFKTYTENLVRALLQIDRQNEYVLYVDRAVKSTDWVPSHANNARVSVLAAAPWPIGAPWREQWQLPWAAARDRLDILHLPALTGPLRLPCPSVVTIHDTIWLDSRAAAGTLPQRLRAIYHRQVGRHVARRAQAIVTPSITSRDQIVRDLGNAAEDVTVIYEAARAGCQPSDAAALAAFLGRYQLEKGYVLGLSSADRRKNLPALAAGFAQLPEELRLRHPLIIAGTLPSLDVQRRLRPIGRFLGPLRDDEMGPLYSAAALFVFPSLQEGFGLPVLEAMACGTPVIAANRSSIPEIAAGAAVLLDDVDGATLAAAMTRLLGDQAQCDDLVRRGLLKAAAFSWRRCAQETIAVYERVAASATQRSRGRAAG